MIDQISLESEIATATYRLTSDGRILSVRHGQESLYDRLSSVSNEAGILLLGPTGYGKTEGVVIPSLGLRRGGAPRRLFLVERDGSTLDDQVHRLVPYLRSSAAGDEIARTWYVDTEEDELRGNQCCRLFPNGSLDCTVVRNPLEADVDLVLTTYSRFRNLFFGSGGVHSLSSSFSPEVGGSTRRDLFFFDEAQDYTPNGFGEFQRIVAYLYAEDKDVVVASSTMPPAFQDELSFLETVRVQMDAGFRAPALRYSPTSTPLNQIEALVRRDFRKDGRTLVVVETISQAEDLHSRLAASFGSSICLYHQGQSSPIRRRFYSELKSRGAMASGYLLITTGSAIETSDLDSELLFTTLCPPDNLILRAGRCNRRGLERSSEFVVVGDALDPGARLMAPAVLEAYTDALTDQSGLPFDADAWKAFI